MGALYAILVTQGLVTVLVHCPGMCGPLMVGLRLRSLGDVLAYQAGKALTYAVMGACAGAAGGGLRLALQQHQRWLVVVLGLGLMAVGGLGLVRRGIGDGPAAPWLGSLVRRAGRGGPLAVGAVLALLPCGVLLWALGLAVASGSPLHGAGLMLTLVAMTTPILAAAHGAGRAGWRFVRWWWMAPVGVVLAGLWLVGQGALGGDPGCVYR